jgi:hypothetical protein
VLGARQNILYFRGCEPVKVCEMLLLRHLSFVFVLNKLGRFGIKQIE